MGKRIVLALQGCAIAAMLAGGCRKNRDVVPTSTHEIQTFENGDEGWIPFGFGAKVEVTHAPDEVKNGNAALALHYVYTPGQYGSAVLPLEPAQLAHLDHLGFWIKTDLATPVIVSLSEKQPGGGYYSSWFWSPKESWQHIDLTPSSFSVNTGPNDPVDPDGKLDLDQVNGIGISDLGQAFQAIPVDSRYLLIDRPTGQHTIWIDDVEFSPATGRHEPGSSNHLIGDTSRGFTTWITMGGCRLETSPQDNPLKGAALKAGCEEQEGRYAVLTHTLANLDLSGVSTLSLRVAATGELKFIVYLEEKKQGSILGPRYSAPLSVPGGSTATPVTLLLRNFNFDSTGPPDEDGKLDASQLRSISLVDVTTTQTHNPKPYTLWLSAIEAH